MKNPRIGLVQMSVCADKEKNLQSAEHGIYEAVSKGADIVVLPEMFICPYITSDFPVFAEPEGGLSWQALSSMARKNNVVLVAGTIPELDGEGNIYNTCFIFDAMGNGIGKHRKVHLFDIALSGGQHFKESDTLTPGNSATVFDTGFCTSGAAVCYDLRFPELFRLMVDQGAELVTIPGAFNMTTGPAHWELLFRTRGLDNQVFMAGCAPARDESGPYISYGNSIITSPWGEILGRLDEKEGVLVREIDLGKLMRIREELPLLKHRRPDVYACC